MAIIVGPVGEELTPVYIGLAEAVVEAAETHGATVATIYSPEATADNVLGVVDGANIVVYFGHGIGTPNPYSDTPNSATVNGWGLNGPRPAGHADSTDDGSLAYYGEAWIAEHAKPAPGWVMIYSNACYAPGAGEGFDEPADEETAATRVASYSRAPLADLGASAYFATDFYEGAAHLVAALLENPTLPYGDVFASEPRFDPDGLVRFSHATVAGAETWLHRSAYFEGREDYWYAFAGNPSMSLAGAATIGSAAVFAVDVDGAVATAQATLTLPESWTISPGAASVIACADRCAELAIASGPGDGPVISDLAAALLFATAGGRTVALQLPTAGGLDPTAYGAAICGRAYRRRADRAAPCTTSRSRSERTTHACAGTSAAHSGPDSAAIGANSSSIARPQHSTDADADADAGSDSPANLDATSQ